MIINLQLLRSAFFFLGELCLSKNGDPVDVDISNKDDGFIKSIALSIRSGVLNTDADISDIVKNIKDLPSRIELQRILGLAEDVIEVVADSDVLIRGADAINAADPLLDAHEVPWHVVVDEPPGRLQVEAFAHGVGADENFQVATAEHGLDLRLCDLGPGPGVGVVDFTAPTGVAAESAVACRDESFADVVHGVGVLGEDNHRRVCVQCLGHVSNELAGLAVFAGDAVEVLEERLEFGDLVAESVGPGVERLRLEQ